MITSTVRVTLVGEDLEGFQSLDPDDHVEVADAAEEQPLSSHANLNLTWLHRNGAAPGTTGLLEQAITTPGSQERRPRYARFAATCCTSAAPPTTIITSRSRTETRRRI